MKAEIITIGDEILIGQVVDSNSAYIAQKLNEIGVSVYQITSVQDDSVHIVKSLKEAEENANIIILTGGLGPTKDDLTKHTLCEYFNDELMMNDAIQNHIKELFSKINYQYTDLDLQQAMLPKKATILKNHLGTASGMWFAKGDKVIISIPGVPNEMKGLMKSSILPILQSTYSLPFILHKTIVTYGMGESKIAQRLALWEEKLPTDIKLAYLPSYGKTRLRLTAKGKVKEKLELILERELQKLLSLVADITLDVDGSESLEANIGKLLVKNKKTIATAESCTGGAIAKIITSVAGASQYFIGSVVSYNERIKTTVLNVSSETINKHSVVSAVVAEEMAKGIQQLYATDYAIAITGNAGPTTDKTDTSVGVVFISIATPNSIITQEFNFGQPRAKVIERATIKSLELLRKVLLK
ncbi:MAG TPA: competence/damage-inducible protein A [Flavobacteriaceae bacterium]|jgi:nicotinamide-nucleotide amidase|nr:competence/damage-inducible protein A [Flavobacteriaceae bacterium]HBS11140.1 competence/damage-inducible protein A [Flavobacteriaceae bacterium]